MKPLAIDLYCGLGGWTEGLLAEGYRVIGYDIEAHNYGDGKRYPAELVIRDVLTIHGSEFKDAALIVASPPCQEYSYMAMPWSRAKAIAAEYRSGKRDVKKLTALFDACFRIQREAIDAAGHFIPMVVENVRGRGLAGHDGILGATTFGAMCRHSCRLPIAEEKLQPVMVPGTRCGKIVRFKGYVTALVTFQWKALKPKA